MFEREIDTMNVVVLSHIVHVNMLCTLQLLPGEETWRFLVIVYCSGCVVNCRGKTNCSTRNTYVIRKSSRLKILIQFENHTLCLSVAALITDRKGRNVFTGVCHSVHNWPHGYSVTVHRTMRSRCVSY